jgi:hypothetical protein
MPIRLLLEHDHAFTPEEVKTLVEAFEDALIALACRPGRPTDNDGRQIHRSVRERR